MSKIVIQRTVPRLERHEFESVSALTKWAITYAEGRKGCEWDDYIRAEYNYDTELLDVIDDKEYTLKKLSQDGWCEVKEVQSKDAPSLDETILDAKKRQLATGFSDNENAKEHEY